MTSRQLFHACVGMCDFKAQRTKVLTDLNPLKVAIRYISCAYLRVLDSLKPALVTTGLPLLFCEKDTSNEQVGSTETQYQGCSAGIHHRKDI